MNYSCLILYCYAPFVLYTIWKEKVDQIKRSTFFLVSHLFVFQINPFDCATEIGRLLNEYASCARCFNCGIIKQFHLARSILNPSYYSIKKHQRFNQLPNCSASHLRNNDHTTKWNMDRTLSVTTIDHIWSSTPKKALWTRRCSLSKWHLFSAKITEEKPTNH